MRRSTHGILLLVSIFAAIPIVGPPVDHVAQSPLHPCTIEGEAGRCGDITVPENYGEPNGRRIALHAVVLGVGNRGEGREPIFVLAGGPGQAATTLTQGASGIFRSVRRTRDVVLIDQRGTGGANRLDCARAPRSLLVPADVGDCVARLSQHATLRYYGTDSFLEDLESTRKMLGYNRVVLFGLSYGTRAAYAYARRYPQSVRAVVLAAPAPVSMRLVDSAGEGGRRSLDAIVADCLEDQRCSRKFPNVGKDAEYFRTNVSEPSRLLGLQSLQSSANTAVLIPMVLKRAAAGDFSPLDSTVAGLREEYQHQLALGLHLTIVCGDELLGAPAPDTISALRAEYARACRGWPAAPVAANFHEPVRLSTPALLLVGEWDPVTSPRVARVAADQFSSSHLVVFPKAGHVLPVFDGARAHWSPGSSKEERLTTRARQRSGDRHMWCVR
jgi:pimeloyl-ACP methyl ester carboxylesterase